MNAAGNTSPKRGFLRRIGALALVAVASGALLVGCSSEVKADVPTLPSEAMSKDVSGQLKEAVEKAMSASGAPGAIVGVWVPWNGSWVSGVGVTEPGGKTEVTADMSFRAGAITREMTCDALYSMANAGVVKLDDEVSDYVAGVGEKKGVTLEQLCDSTSGIAPVDPAVQAQFLSHPDRVWTGRELAAFGLGRPVTGEPGAALAESDTGYLLLGLALERASDMSASEYLKKYVFDPLSLSSTSLPAPAVAEPAPAPALPGYLPVPGEGGALNCAEPKNVTKISSSIGFTDSGVTTRIEDLGKYAAALAKNSLGNQKDKRFADPQPGYKDAPTWYNQIGGSRLVGTLIGQSGSTLGYSTAAFSDKETGLTVAVTLNSSVNAGIAHDLALELASIASKAPASEGQKAPEAGLPFSADQYAQSVQNAKVCG